MFTITILKDIWDISSRLRTLESSLRSSFMRFVWGDDILAARKKWEVHSISRPQEHGGLIVS